MLNVVKYNGEKRKKKLTPSHLKIMGYFLKKKRKSWDIVRNELMLLRLFHFYHKFSDLDWEK